MRIIIVVTHLLGAGHLRRSLNLAQAYARAGHEVSLVSGGVPVPQFPSLGVAIVQLPPVRSDGVQFKRLLTQDGSVVTDEYLGSRRSILLDLVRRFEPDVIITELYPFGRRSLRLEFQALLKTAIGLPKRPVILSSVRDILSAPSSAKKALETEQIVDNFYDAVLVHSDPEVTLLNVSWPVSNQLSDKLRYTGFVSQRMPVTLAANRRGTEVVVSAGGGPVGGRLFEVAIAAASLCCELALSRELTWRILVGGKDAVSEVNRLTALSATVPGVVIESVRPDFRQLLQQAACSVSLCGYNTAVDLLQTGTPGVLVPFDDGGETEQGLRARSMSRHSAYSIVFAVNLSAQSLIQAIGEVRSAGGYSPNSLQFDGAAETVRMTEDLVGKRADR